MKIRQQLWIYGPVLLTLAYIGTVARKNNIRLHYNELKSEVRQSYMGELGNIYKDIGELQANEMIVQNGIKYKGITEETVKKQKDDLNEKHKKFELKYKGIMDKLNNEERDALSYWWMPLK